MTAQERAELSDLRKEILSEFKDLRALHIDLIQRVAKLEAAASTTQASTQLRITQGGLILSMIMAGWSILTTH